MKQFAVQCLLIGFALLSASGTAAIAHSASNVQHPTGGAAVHEAQLAASIRHLLQTNETGGPNRTVLISASVDATSTVKGRAIPASFAGHSIEWDNPRKTKLTADDKLHISRLGANYSFSTMLQTPGYIPLLKLLTNGNANGPFVIRMGGNSEDLVETFRTSTLQMLARLQKGLGVKFIIGLNFLQERTKRLPVAQAKQVLKYLPQSSVIAYEVGNEPDHFYKKSDPKSFGRYLTLWKPVANALVPIVGNKLAGPAWAQPNIPAANLTAMLNAKSKTMSLVTGHYYYNGAFVKGANYKQILIERAVGNAASKAAPGAALAKKYGKKFRMAELNSFYNGGLKGGSDVFAASLWSLDLMLSVANVGVVGTDFHNYERTPYNTLQRTQGANGKFFTVAKPVFYGQWVFQKAVAGGVSIVPVTANISTENVKVWALKPKSGKGLRLVVINKTGAAGQAQFAISGLPAGSVGKLYALTAPSITAGSDVKFGNITAEAAVAGASFQFSAVTGQPAPAASGATQYTLDIPAFYAALVNF